MIKEKGDIMHKIKKYVFILIMIVSIFASSKNVKAYDIRTNYDMEYTLKKVSGYEQAPSEIQIIDTYINPRYVFADSQNCLVGSEGSSAKRGCVLLTRVSKINGLNVTKVRIHNFTSSSTANTNSIVFDYIKSRGVSANIISDVSASSYDSYRNYCQAVKNKLEDLGLSDIWEDPEYAGASGLRTTADGNKISETDIIKICTSDYYARQFFGIQKDIGTDADDLEVGQNDIAYTPLNYLKNGLSTNLSAIKNSENKKICARISGDTLEVVVTKETMTQSNCESMFQNNAAVYEITNLLYTSDDSYISNVKSHTQTFACEWKYTTSENNTVDMKFKGNVNYETGKIRFSAEKNIEKLYPYLILSESDMEHLLNRDNSILNAFANSIAASEPEIVDGGTIALAVAVGVGVGLVSVVHSVLSGGTTASIGVITTTAAISGVLASATVITAKIVISNTLNSVRGVFDDYPGVVHFSYGSQKTVKDAYSGVSCYYEDSALSDDNKINYNYEVTCENLMSGEFGKILDFIMNIMRFVAIALLILFSTFDFVKPIVNGDSEELTKSGGKFIKRLIIAVLVFFVPVIVRMLLSLIGRTC